MGKRNKGRDAAPEQKAETAKPGKKKAKAAAKPAKPAASARFRVLVSVVALTVTDGSLLVATTDGALPGVELGAAEAIEAAAGRALRTAGLSAGGFILLPLATDRDVDETLRAAWVALGRPEATHDVAWLAPDDVDPAHRLVVGLAVERLATLLETTTVAATLCPPTFTVGELRQVYRAVWGLDPDGRNFHRKVTGVDDFLIPTEQRSARSGGRPALLYRAGRARRLNPAISRP